MQSIIEFPQTRSDEVEHHMKSLNITFSSIFAALLVINAPCSAQGLPSQEERSISTKQAVNSRRAAAPASSGTTRKTSVLSTVSKGSKRRSKSKSKENFPDFKIPGLQKISSDSYDTFELGDGFKASRNGNSIMVAIPGAYLDTLTSGHSNTLIDQLAGTTYLKVIDTNATTLNQAFEERCYLGSRVVKRAGDDVRIYSFKARNGRIAKIFIYLNELSGVTGVVEMSEKHSYH